LEFPMFALYEVLVQTGSSLSQTCTLIDALFAGLLLTFFTQFLRMKTKNATP
jgi:hypothetical protein